MSIVQHAQKHSRLDQTGRSSESCSEYIGSSPIPAIIILPFVVC